MVLQDGSAHLLLSIIRLFARFGVSCLSAAVCATFQISLIVYSFFFAYVQRNQVYRAMTIDNAMLYKHSVQFSFESEKNSMHRAFNRVLSFKRSLTDYFIFLLNAIRPYLIGGSSNVDEKRSVEMARLICTGQSNQLQQQLKVGDEFIESVTKAIQSFDGCDDGIINFLFDDQIEPIIHLMPNSSSGSSNMRSVFLNRCGRQASSATLVNEFITNPQLLL